MHSLIVIAHPEAGSYTHAVAEQVIGGLKDSPHNTYEIADLTAEDFDPRYTAADYRAFRDGTAPPADIVAEQARIDRADLLILIFPVYWWSLPAILKGWIDRVFTNGWAYIDAGGEDTTRLLGRLAVQTIAIGGATQRTYHKRGYAQAIQTQIDQGIFGYVGARMVGSELLLPLDAASSQAGLQRAREIGANLTSAIRDGKGV
ncbi:NAD(P)H dehydrogenase [Xaviernesmea oryzae]|uniref:NAD(P)H dehydrogenase n=1 Tax=Xaviernesmea oryzae TaxID=464029 RepID=A0A1Q9AWF6_9HYPH|nr:NAD(P)H-dependent oxidoreductase [Xaviernesmea oryzae]OLP59759.1 NAD(P)H dehydrogenase [Xaviernesmea oryzae]SEM10127.1 NAD(P)H dehydrogenase (quinone) [Xaviernesmea oryzae]